jgi:hypothetical protein
MKDIKFFWNIGLLFNVLLIQTQLIAANEKNFKYSDSSIQKHWKGYSIIGNGNICAVYSDDKRIEGKGIHHLYYNNYTFNYINGSSFNLYQNSSKLVPSFEETGNADFFATSTKSYINNAQLYEIKCFAYPESAIILTFTLNSEMSNLIDTCKIDLTNELKTDKETKLISLKANKNLAVANWSNNVNLIVGCKNSNQSVFIDGSKILISGKISFGEKVEIIIVPSNDLESGFLSFKKINNDIDIYNTSENYWNSWMNNGILPNFYGNDKSYIDYYKKNLYCVKSALIHGQIPADITGQFVTNNMPQIYPRDEMMCARVFLLTGHQQEAKEIIEFWKNKTIPQKSIGEWYARYDANINAVDAGSGAKYDEPEWDANGYYIQLIYMYYKQYKTWLVDKSFIYELSDFLKSKIDKNNLLYEGGIVEWTGYLPATNMTCAAALSSASEIAEIFGDHKKSAIYKSASEKISTSLHKMFDNSRKIYADMRFTGRKGFNNESLSEETKDTVLLWDTSSNFGIIWGYPNHSDIITTNNFYLNNTFKLGGGVQYFDTFDKSLIDYGHACFFFTTSVSAQFQALYGSVNIAKTNIDWMINNANIYGLMPERIYLNNTDCSPATPLSWCCAEFSAAIIYYSKAIDKN